MNIPLQEWISQQIVRNEMLWKGAFGEQMAFLRDALEPLASTGLPCRRGVARVISTHRSKSIDLPVVEFARPDIGLRMIVRDNFYNWKLTVLSKKPIEADFGPLFCTHPPPEPDYTGDSLSPLYFEGFPEDLVRGYYSQNKAEWSAEIHGDYSVWTAVFMCMRALGAMPDIRYFTREEHRKQLEAAERSVRLASGAGQ